VVTVTDMGTPSVVQTGGVSRVGWLDIAPGATYTLSGGLMDIGHRLDLEGTLDFAGGHATLHGQGILDFTAGEILSAGSASLRVGPGGLVVFPHGTDPMLVFERFVNEGILHYPGDDIDIVGRQWIIGGGALTGHVRCAGVLAAYPDEILDLTGGLEVSPAGAVDLGRGVLNVDDECSGLDDGTLNAGGIRVGFDSIGRFVQTSGTVALDGYRSAGEGRLILGYDPSTEGTYELRGGTLAPEQLDVGRSGRGHFIQTAGLLDVGGVRVNGPDTAGGDPAVYELSGSGRIDAYGMCVGSTAVGLFRQTGGTVILREESTGGSLILGQEAGSSGTYELSDGELDMVGWMIVGRSGSGQFIQSGGSVDVSWVLALAKARSWTNESSGQYFLSGGRLTTDEAYIGSKGAAHFVHTGGTCTVAETLYLPYYGGYEPCIYTLSGTGELSAGQVIIGRNGTGVFQQQGGTCTVVRTMSVGWSGAPGVPGEDRYELTGGTLACPVIYVGDHEEGHLIHSGGLCQVSNVLYVAHPDSARYGGTYELSGTGHLQADRAVVGGQGTGTVVQTGGLAEIDHLRVNATGSYELTGGR